MKDVAAIILAAGRSKRMGAFKPLLPFGKQSVIKSCIKYLEDGGVESIVVVTGHRSDDIRKHLSDTSVNFAFNPDPESEMGASIAAGVSALPSNVNATLIAPVDYPAIPSSVVSALLTEWTKGIRLLKPTSDGRGGHPVLVDLSLRDELLNLDPDLGLKGLFDKHSGEVRGLEVDSPYIAQDIDTWDDYRALYIEVFGTEPSETAKDFANENT
jgi:molybdenum cofactor cytidylyltransferase